MVTRQPIVGHRLVSTVQQSMHNPTSNNSTAAGLSCCTALYVSIPSVLHAPAFQSLQFHNWRIAHCVHAPRLATWWLQVDELTRRSAAVAARIAQKEKDAGSDLDTLRVCPVTGQAEYLCLLALLAYAPQLVSARLLFDAC